MVERYSLELPTNLKMCYFQAFLLRANRLQTEHELQFRIGSLLILKSHFGDSVSIRATFYPKYKRGMSAVLLKLHKIMTCSQNSV
jgi:hypothetical protein